MKKNKVQEMPPRYKQLLSVLRPGAEQALSSSEIRQLTGISRRDASEITAALIKDYGLLIGASRTPPLYGYYLIETEDELKNTLRALNNEMQGILNRHQALQTNFYTE